MKKKLLSLALAMALSMLPAAAAAEEEAGRKVATHTSLGEAAINTADIGDWEYFGDFTVSNDDYKVTFTPYDGGTEKPAGTNPYDYTVAIEVTGLKEHENYPGHLGYWVGIPLDHGQATYVKYAWSTDFGNKAAVEASADYDNYYLNAASPYQYLRVAFYSGNPDAEEADVDALTISDTIYKIDVSGVKMIPNKVTVTAPEVESDAWDMSVDWNMKAGTQNIDLENAAFAFGLHHGDYVPEGQEDPEQISEWLAVLGEGGGVEIGEGTTPLKVTSFHNGNYSSRVYLDEPLEPGDYVLTVSYFYGGPRQTPFNYVTFTVEGDGSESLPGLGSGGIGGDVGDEGDAEKVLDSVKDMDEDAQKDISDAFNDAFESDDDETSEAGWAVLESFAKLDEAVAAAGGITVTPVRQTNAPAELNTNSIKISNAALNAKDTGVKIELKIGAAEEEHTLPSNYRDGEAVAFSMELTNVRSASSLKIPVVITMRLPSTFAPSRTRVLHYHASSSKPDALPSKVDGRDITFVVPGFSDFVLAEYSATTSSGSGSGSGGNSAAGGTVVVGGGNITVTTPVGSDTVTGGSTASGGIFTDVAAGHTFAAPIQWARDNGVMSGYSDGGFHPDAYTNRQQMWMVLGRLAGAAPADMAAAQAWSISSGISDGTNPTGTLSRQQLITMLYRVETASGTPAGSADLSAFGDSGLVASYAKEAMAWAIANGIITGNNGNLNPEGPATRAHFAAFLYRYANLPATSASAVDET